MTHETVWGLSPNRFIVFSIVMGRLILGYLPSVYLNLLTSRAILYMEDAKKGGW